MTKPTESRGCVINSSIFLLCGLIVKHCSISILSQQGEVHTPNRSSTVEVNRSRAVRMRIYRVGSVAAPCPRRRTTLVSPTDKTLLISLTAEYRNSKNEWNSFQSFGNFQVCESYMGEPMIRVEKPCMCIGLDRALVILLPGQSRFLCFGKEDRPKI